MSIKKALFCIGGFALFLTLYFCLPLWLSMIFYFFLTYVVVPPFLWVGVFNTTGGKRAFFIGAIVAGLPHALIVVYLMALTGFGMSLAGFAGQGDPNAEYLGRLLTLASFLPGLFGGLFGMFYYHFFNFAGVPRKTARERAKKPEKPTDPFSEDDWKGPAEVSTAKD